MPQRGVSIDFRRRTALYRLFDDAGCLLYVGIAFNPRDRWQGHSATKSWWSQVARREVTWYSTRSEAAGAESDAIRAECPLYNIAGAVVPPPAVPAEPRRVRHQCDLACRELTDAGARWRKSKAALKDADTELHALLREGRRAGMSVARLAELSGYSRERVARIAPAPKS